MPTKFKKDFKRWDRATRTTTVEKFFIKDTTLQVLMDYINNPMGRPKIKQKCRNEVVRRGYRIVSKVVDSE